MDVQYKSNMQNVGGYLLLLPNELLNIVERYAKLNDIIYLSKVWLQCDDICHTFGEYISQLSITIYTYKILIPFEYGFIHTFIIFRFKELSDSFNEKYLNIINRELLLIKNAQCSIMFANIYNNMTFIPFETRELIEAYNSLFVKGYYMNVHVEKYLTSIGIKI